MAVSAPASITIGDVIRGEEVTISWSTVPDAFAYRVQRSVNGALFGDEIINNTTLTSMKDVAGKNWNTVQYRVQTGAYVGGYIEYSDWTTSPIINVEQSATDSPPAPASITVGEFIPGESIVVSWDAPVSGSIRYHLQRSINGGEFTDAKISNGVWHRETAGEDWESVQYRVRAESISGENYSEWVTSEVKTAGTVTPPTPVTGMARLEQFQNSEGVDIYPRTIVEGIFRKSDGLSLERILTDIKSEIGNALYSTFYVDAANGSLIMVADDSYAGPQFRLVNGELEVVYG